MHFLKRINDAAGRINNLFEYGMFLGKALVFAAYNLQGKQPDENNNKGKDEDDPYDVASGLRKNRHDKMKKLFERHKEIVLQKW